MRAFWITFLHEAVADLTGKHVFVIISAPEFLGGAVLGTEHGDGTRKVVSLQGEFGLNGLFKRLRQILWRVQHTAVVDVGNVDQELVVLEFGLRGLDRNTSLSCDTAHSNFRNASEECIVGCVLCGRIQRTRHDFCSGVASFSTASQMGGKFTTAKVGQHGGGG